MGEKLRQIARHGRAEQFGFDQPGELTLESVSRRAPQCSPEATAPFRGCRPLGFSFFTALALGEFGEFPRLQFSPCSHKRIPRDRRGDPGEIAVQRASDALNAGPRAGMTRVREVEQQHRTHSPRVWTVML